MARTERSGGVAAKATGSPALEIEADALALPVFEEDLRGAGPVKALGALLDGDLAALARAERFEGKPGQELSVPTLGRAPARRVILAGLGPRAKALGGDAGAHEALRMAAGKAARSASKGGARSLAVAVPDGVLGDGLAGAARALAEGALLGGYQFERYKTGEDRGRGAVSEVTVA